MDSTSLFSIIHPQVLNPRVARIVSAFLRNILRMPRLHTARFSGIIMEQAHLALLFQSNNLHTLILSRCGLCTILGLPLPRIRHLTLLWIPVDDWPHMVSLFGHCSANLETLDLIGELGQVPGSTRLPIFPKLRNLKLMIALVSTDHIGRFVHLTPQLEHLEIWGHHPIPRMPALPAGLNRLTINGWMIGQASFDPLPHLHLSHLRIKGYSIVRGVRDDNSYSKIIIPIIQHVFPNLTSLEVDIYYHSRDFALSVARSLPNVTRLQLNVLAALYPLYDNDTSWYFAETPEGPLSHLYVNATAQMLGVELLQKWIICTVLQPPLRLGGPHLQEVNMVFPKPGTEILNVWWCWKQVKEEWFFEQY